MLGKTISHYRIIEKLGAGGMGEVYLAEDSRLDRKIALKILPQHLSEKAELRERFEREARAVTATTTLCLTPQSNRSTIFPTVPRPSRAPRITSAGESI